MLDMKELAAVLIGSAIAAGAVLAQTTVPRTPDGRPSLEGIWDFGTLTPLQRPQELASTPFLTKEEAARFVLRTVDEQNTDRPLPRGPVDVRTFSMLAFNDFWWERPSSMAVVRGRIRSSLITDPLDGRLPALTPEGEARSAAQQQVMQRNVADDPEQRPLTERCLASHAGPPMLPGNETSFAQIVQTLDYVVIAAEASNDARIVTLDRRAHLPASVPGWRGDSRGRWEGDTLVVDTTNMRPGAALSSGRAVTDGAIHLVERFTMEDADTLLYGFTLDAPRTFVRPWTAMVPMKRSSSRMFEYACHEGNYGLGGILRGARAQERNK